MRLVRRGALSATPFLLLISLILASTPAFSSQLTSINAQSTSRLKAGGALLLPIAHEPTQFNPWHRDGNEPDINQMMSASLPMLLNSDDQGKLTANKNYISSFTQTRSSPQTLRIVLNPKAMWSDGNWKKNSQTVQKFSDPGGPGQAGRQTPPGGVCILAIFWKIAQGWVGTPPPGGGSAPP